MRLVQRGCFDSVFNAGGREFPTFKYQSTKLTTAVHIHVAGIACGKLTFHRPISQHSADSSTSCMLPLKHFANQIEDSHRQKLCSIIQSF